MDLKDIKAIIDLMKKNSISEFELEREDFKIRMKRGIGNVPATADDNVPALPIAVQPLALPVAQSVSAPVPIPAKSTGESEIKSPMIGTFYRSPSPESAPYVEVGTEVGPETVVCIIEAMKVMNEIKAEVKGVVTAVIAENTKPVEFGQPLFRIRPT